jgi:hypothetical protein
MQTINARSNRKILRDVVLSSKKRCEDKAQETLGATATTTTAPHTDCNKQRKSHIKKDLNVTFQLIEASLITVKYV